jgi:hypothetical protein
MIAFYIALPHNKSIILNEDIMHYLSAIEPDERKLLIYKEVSKTAHQDISGQHFHVLVSWNDKTYDTFRKTILIKKYGLRGQSKDGLPRQYGRVTKIRDPLRMAAYTAKGGDPVAQEGYTNEDITKFNEISFIKEEKKTFIEDLMEHLMEERHRFIDPSGEILIKIIILQTIILKYHIDKQDKPLSRPKLEYYTNHYIQCIEPLRNRPDFLEEILIYIIKK